jgi:peptidoglycan/LPS O-acetylase OafA/YrhL
VTLGAAFNPRSNALTPLRLILALLVVFSHGYVTSGFGRDPLFELTSGRFQLGTVAVVSFFALSGFLLTGSRERSSLTVFARNRALRIMPGLLVCLAFVALVIVPIAKALGGTAEPSQVVNFVVQNATFSVIPPQITGLFPGQEFPNQPDLSLWSLSPEVICYVGLALIPKRLLSVAAVELFLVAVAVNVYTGGTSQYLHLPVAFLAGASLYVHRDRVPLSIPLAVALGALLILSVPVGLEAVLAPVVLPYYALWLGARLPLRWERDLSYGTYIYAWPIQQTVAVAGVATAGLLVFDLVTVPIILGLAFVSAVVVEEPAVRLGRRLRRAAEPVAAAAVSTPIGTES